MNSSDKVVENLTVAKNLVAQSVEQGARLVVLPESFSFLGESMAQQRMHAEVYGEGLIQTALQDMAKQFEVWIVAGTIPLLTEQTDKLSAACLVYNSQGKVVARYDKMHLFDAALPHSTESYSESCIFSPGNEVVVIDSPVGKLGIAVCYDMRFPEMFRLQVEQGMQVLACPAAFTQKTGAAHWHTLLRARAIENLCYVAAAAQAGTHSSGRETYGHSLVYDAWGERLAECPVGEGLIVAEVDLARQQQLRMQFPVLSHRRL